MEATLSSRGQATIPKTVRDHQQIRPGDRFKFCFHPDGVIILPKIPTSRLKGILPKPAKPVSAEEFDRAIESGATQRFRRKKMMGLDTNALLRYLAQDDPKQSARATEIIERRLTEQEPGFISLATILEVVWVLKSIFKRSRREIANDIEMLPAADTLEVPNEQEVYPNSAVVSLRNGIGTFEDALIGSLGAWRGCSAICS
jgi:AbrB family looped-hinge helix DNA binding protein